MNSPTGIDRLKKAISNEPCGKRKTHANAAKRAKSGEPPFTGAWRLEHALANRAWDEAEHPRAPAGSSIGGRFIAAWSGNETAEHRRKRHRDELHDIAKRDRDILEKLGLGDLTGADLEKAYDELEADMSAFDQKSGGAAIPDARGLRDAVWQKHSDAAYCTFDIQSGEQKEYDSGWGVTFQTTSSESGANRLSDAEYDRTAARMASVFDCPPNVGVYEGACEISYKCEDTRRAIAAMVRFEQKEIYNYALGEGIQNYTFNQAENALKHPQDK